LEKNLKALISELKSKPYLFDTLSEEELEKIAPYLEVNRYPKGATFFNEGDPGDFLGIVTSGKLEAKKKTSFERSQMVLAVLSKGSFVGELSMLDERPRSATVEALEDSEVIVLKRDALDEFTNKYPDVGVKVLRKMGKILSVRLRQSSDRLGIMF